jgi:manganese/zinc/iron transport system permease protein
MDDFLRLITLQDSNTRTVLFGAAALGLSAGVVGCFAVLRRRALLGDAVAHAALPGVCAAFLIVGDRSMPAFLLGALVFGALAVLCISAIQRATRVKADAAIAIVLATFFGLGIVMSQRIMADPTGGNRAGLDSFLFGKAASMVRADAMLIASVGLVVVLTVAMFFKELKLLAFDRTFAAGIGRPVGAMDLALMLLICLVTVIGLPAVGVVLMVALLVIPAAAARFWTESLGVMLIIAGVVGALSGALGTGVSAVAEGVSAGPVIALAAAAMFTLSMLVAPQRGLIASWHRARTLRRRILLENLLRALYELDEAAHRNQSDGREGELALKRSWTPSQLSRAIARARRLGLIEPGRGTITLTQAGATAAAGIVRRHRLWELFLIEQAAIAPDHVDRDADAIEHVLPPDLLAQLEARLMELGRQPRPVPPSPHAISPFDKAGALG